MQKRVRCRAKFGDSIMSSDDVLEDIAGESALTVDRSHIVKSGKIPQYNEVMIATSRSIP